MMPVAPAAIHGRDRSKVFIATLKPCPSSPTRCSRVSFTSSKSTSLVSEARWPSLSSFLPTETPGASRGTTKQVMPLWRPEGSPMRPNTVYHWAKRALVIQRFWPSITYSLPTLRTVVRMPATSEPASGSLHAYAAKMGASVSEPSHFFFCSSVPARMIGMAARLLPRSVVPIPAQP